VDGSPQPASAPRFRSHSSCASKPSASPTRTGSSTSSWSSGAARFPAPVFRVIHEAAAADAEIAALEKARSTQRLENYATCARLLAARGALRTGLTTDEAAAAIFAIGQPETYRALVTDGAWDNDQWAAWAERALVAVLLEPGARR
jgi:hypothetical protein